MSKGGGGTTTVQQADPWSGLQPYLSYGFGQAQNLYQNPSQYYPGQTYLPMNEFTQGGVYEQLGNVDELRNLSGAAQGGVDTLLGAGDIYNNPTAGNWSQALSQDLYGNVDRSMGQIGRGFSNLGEDYNYQTGNLIGRQQRGLDAMGSSLSDQFANLVGQQQRAYGAQSAQTMDDLMAMRERQMRDYDVSAGRLNESLAENVLPGIASQAIGAGQAGSSRQGVAEGIARGKTAQALSEMARTQDETLASQLRSSGIGLGNLGRSMTENLGSSARTGIADLGSYGRSAAETLGDSTAGSVLGMSQAAREGMAQMGDVGTSLANKANLGLSDFYSNQYGQGLDAVSQGILGSGQVASLSQMPSQSLYGVGDIMQAEGMKPLQESMDRYYYNQQAPWNDLQSYVAAINGLPISGGTKRTSTPTNPMGGAIGGGMTGYALGTLASDAMAGSSYGPLGALGGALLGAYMNR